MVAKHNIANANPSEDRIAAFLLKLGSVNSRARSNTDLIYRHIDNGTADELLPSTITDGLAHTLEAHAEIAGLIDGLWEELRPAAG